MTGPRTRARGLRSFVLVTEALLALTACEDISYRDIGGAITLVSTRNDALVPPASARLTTFGRRALPQIETALHTASPTGKRHLIAVLTRIGDAEAVPILRHFAFYDTDESVREACRETLENWARTDNARAERARAALVWMQDRRAQGDGPMVMGEAKTQ